MARAEHCSTAACAQAAVSSLEGQALCRSHFIIACYARLDHYATTQKGHILSGPESEAIRRFIDECTRKADEIEHGAKHLDNLERARLLLIIEEAGELGRHLRRSPRKTASIAVRLVRDMPGDSWEEKTETALLSRYGATVRCSHPVKPGDILEITRSDTGQKAQVRVTCQHFSEIEGVGIGIEFVNSDNFWGLNWAAVEEGL
jgi:hypothetical protein